MMKIVFPCYEYGCVEERRPKHAKHKCADEPTSNRPEYTDDTTRDNEAHWVGKQQQSVARPKWKSFSSQQGQPDASSAYQ